MGWGIYKDKSTEVIDREVLHIGSSGRRPKPEKRRTVCSSTVCVTPTVFVMYSVKTAHAVECSTWASQVVCLLHFKSQLGTVYISNMVLAYVFPFEEWSDLHFGGEVRLSRLCTVSHSLMWCCQQPALLS